MKLFIALLSLLSVRVFAQEIKVEYDKKHDFSKYKTFSFGEASVRSASDQKQTDEMINAWIKGGVKRELEYKGLHQVDSLADLLVTYAMITEARLDLQPLGPAGMTPGSNDRTWSRNYTETTLVIDLNDRNNFLQWRVKGTADVTGRDSERTIDMIVVKGFKKFGKTGRKK